MLHTIDINRYKKTPQLKVQKVLECVGSKYRYCIVSYSLYLLVRFCLIKIV